MNNHDLDEIRFLLTASEQQLTEWYENATDIERSYAQELLIRYHNEMVKRAEQAMQEWELEEMTVDNNFPAAKQVLQKYLH